jgi:MoxR-like ATPase
MRKIVDTDIKSARILIEKIIKNVEEVMVGKREVIELAVIALLSQGHLLIEDAPGVGKTMLARSLARSIDCSFSRIQFTPDMLPGDITGVSVYNQKIGDFEFRTGPIVAQIVLADEINRATPKVQSALLEAMEEKQISVDGFTHKMPAPYHVLATQNPIEYEGTFPLPEAQLDRFLLRINIGYPSLPDEISVMERQQFTHPIEKIGHVVDSDDILTLQETVKKIHLAIILPYISGLHLVALWRWRERARLAHYYRGVNTCCLTISRRWPCPHWLIGRYCPLRGRRWVRKAASLLLKYSIPCPCPERYPVNI